MRDAEVVFHSYVRMEAVYCNYGVFNIGLDFTTDKSTYLCNFCNSLVLPPSLFHHPISDVSTLLFPEPQQLVCQFWINLLEKDIRTLQQSHSFILAISLWYAPKHTNHSIIALTPESLQDTTWLSGNHPYMHISSSISIP